MKMCIMILPKDGQFFRVKGTSRISNGKILSTYSKIFILTLSCIYLFQKFCDKNMFIRRYEILTEISSSCMPKSLLGLLLMADHIHFILYSIQFRMDLYINVDITTITFSLCKIFESRH